VGYADSLNMYAYVGGDPVNGVDPSGLMVEDPGGYDNRSVLQRSGNFARAVAERANSLIGKAARSPFSRILRALNLGLRLEDIFKSPDRAMTEAGFSEMEQEIMLHADAMLNSSLMNSLAQAAARGRDAQVVIETVVVTVEAGMAGVSVDAMTMYSPNGRFRGFHLNPDVFYDRSRLAAAILQELYRAAHSNALRVQEVSAASAAGETASARAFVTRAMEYMYDLPGFHMDPGACRAGTPCWSNQ